MVVGVCNFSPTNSMGRWEVETRESGKRGVNGSEAQVYSIVLEITRETLPHKQGGRRDPTPQKTFSDLHIEVTEHTPAYAYTSVYKE